MAYYTSIHLAFKPELLPDFEKEFGYTYETDYGSHGYSEPTDISKEQVVQQKVHEIMQSVFEKSTNSTFLSIEGSYLKHHVFDTPLGKREMIFNFGYKSRNFEGGYLQNQDLIGIEISGRYYPNFIDWHSEHGGFDDSGLLDITDRLKMIDELKEALIQYNDFFKILRIYLKEDFA